MSVDEGWDHLVLPDGGEGQILVCDDDSSIRTIIREHLVRQGYDVLEAASGAEAGEVASAHNVEAMLLDL